MVRLLFLCIRARPDIQIAIAFLRTRFSGLIRMTGRSSGEYSVSSGYKRHCIEIVGNNLKYCQVVGWCLVWHRLWHKEPYWRCKVPWQRYYLRVLHPEKLKNKKLDWRRASCTSRYNVTKLVEQKLYWSTRFRGDREFAGVRQKSLIPLVKNGWGSGSKQNSHNIIRYFFVKSRITSGDFCEYRIVLPAKW